VPAKDVAKDLGAIDRAVYVHSSTNLQQHLVDGPMVLTRGEGVRVFDGDGKAYIEAMSGLWCAGLGFSEKRLADAAYKQMTTLPYYHNFQGKTADVTIELAERLVALAPKPLTKIMFASSGSEANDTAIKLTWYYNNARGKPAKKKIISREQAYHGVTIAAGSLTRLKSINDGFDLPIDRIHHVGCPHHYRLALDNESEEQFATRLADELDAKIKEEGSDTVAAFIAEPIMGAGGVIVPPATYFEKIQRVLKAHDVLLICDEVITGFGRIGTMFGAEKYGIAPDIMTLGKQMTSAYAPMSAILMRESVFESIAAESGKRGTFGHGYTYSGHPVSAAVALETLRIYEERDILGHVNRITPTFQSLLQSYSNHPLVGEVRGEGLLAAVQLVQSKSPKKFFDPTAGLAKYLVARGHEHGVILRVLQNDAVAFAPPLISTEDELKQIADLFGRALDDTLKIARERGLV
jgi:4-aminobutyrate--pyruvate transaminase